LRGDATQTNGYERFLYIEESIPLGGPRHRRQEQATFRSIASQIDSTSVFSRLVLLAIVNIMTSPHRLQLTLFRPISLATFLKICNQWSSGIATDLISLFSRNYYILESLEKVPWRASPTSKNITDLVVKPGAYVSWSLGARETPKRPSAVKHLSWCGGHVYIEDGVDMKGIKETLAMIFVYPGRAGEPTDGSSRKPRSAFSIDCSSSVVSLISSAVSYRLATVNQTDQT
jgi:hypothetical protein